MIWILYFLIIWLIIGAVVDSIVKTHKESQPRKNQRRKVLALQAEMEKHRK